MIVSKKNVLCTALLLTGCGGTAAKEADFGSALPTQEMLHVKSPGQAAQTFKAVGTVHALMNQGEQSDLYRTTRNTTDLVNGATLAVLTLVGNVTQYQATSVKGDTAVWGPHSDALHPNAWRLTVTKTGEQTYTYALAGKDKTAADSAFVDVITGTQIAVLDANGGVRKGFGQGELTLNWEHARTLPDHDDNIGTFTVKYSRPDEKSNITVNATFQGVKSDQGNPTNAEYRYSSVPGQGGEFDFKLLQDIYKPAGSTSSQLETLTIKSRWLETGEGRSDVKISGGDLKAGQEGTVNECWDAKFLSQYYLNSYNPSATYGTEAANCKFTPAVYSSL